MNDASTTEQLEPARAARVTLAQITRGGDANAFGTVHGGVLLRLADECGAVAALRHATSSTGSRVKMITTAAIDAFTFLTPVGVGELLEVTAEVTRVGRSSIEARIEVHAEALARRGRRLVAVGFGLFVALDEHGAPAVATPLRSETDADHARDEAARRRQAVRLSLREEARALEPRDSGGASSTHP